MITFVPEVNPLYRTVTVLSKVQLFPVTVSLDYSKTF